MNKFLAGILAFLMWLMPWWGALRDLHTRFSFDENAIWQQVKTCVETHDVATLESMMRPWIKNNVDGLSEKVGNLLDSVSGEITRISIDSSIESGNDGGLYSVGKEIHIFTTEKLHYLRIDYTVTNSRDSKDTGISRLKLFTGKLNTPEYTILAEIKAPDGF